MIKPAASLTSNLLARKGTAAPAAAWRPLPATAPGPTPQIEPQRAAEPSRTAPHPFRAKMNGGGPAVPDKPRVAMTLRLDHDRHLRLRLLSAHLNRSSQQLLVEALDALLDEHVCRLGECACLNDVSTCVSKAEA